MSNSRVYQYSIHKQAVFIWGIALSITTSTATLSGYERDRRALLAFKSKIVHYPQGVFSSWNNSLHFCKWEGITCGHRHKRVTVLNLSSKGLMGSLSPAIGNLSFLQQIILSKNTLQGAIPQELGKLFRLKVLILTNNSLDGEIPKNLSLCSKLNHLSVANNKLVGKIPIELASLSKLQELFLDSNHLSGEIPPSIGNLTSLKILSASNNVFGGQIPDTFGQLKSLIILELGTNKLSGTIPTSLFNLSLVNISLADNHLHGTLPLDLGLTLPNLQKIRLLNNKFTGSIPISLSNATKLGAIEMQSNTFNGHVSIDFGHLNHLYKLSLTSNNLGSGEEGDLNFLDSLINCSSLVMLELGDNNFGGSLPNSIANLSTELIMINLAWNQISGGIPSGMSNLINLILLALDGNQFTGIIPSEIVKLQRLQRLVLSNNELVGKIPTTIGNLSMLDELQFQNNKLEGTIPPSFGSCTLLVLLDLSQNNLSGTIPSKLFGAPFSIGLNLSRNCLVGSLPSEFGNSNSLGAIDVSENELSGVIPYDLRAFTVLEKLYIQGNFIKGSIPQTLYLRGMQYLDLSRNNMSGKIPDFMETLSLIYLNLSLNDFEGEVPMKGVFAIVSSFSVLGNKRLCGGIPELHLPRCNIDGPNKHPLVQVTISIVSMLISLIIVSSLYRFRLIRRKNKLRGTTDWLSSVDLPWKLSYEKLYKATNGFSSTNLVSVGVFTSLYKGIFPDEKIVAIKVFHPRPGGASSSFITECKVLRNTRHGNLINIITTCSSVDYEGNSFEAIVHEFMDLGSLEWWLHASQETYQNGHYNPQSLSLHRRINIAMDVAYALDYLHHQCGNAIVHCDLKPSNILLDRDVVAHVGNFGMARILPNFSNSNQSSSVGKGERGLQSEVSTKGDVYSYGILILEMLTGKKPNDPMFHGDISLEKFVWMALPDGIMEIVDPVILPGLTKDDTELITTTDLTSGEVMSTNQMKDCLTTMLKIGLQCSMDSPQAQPSISDVLRMLESGMKFLKVSYKELHKATNGFSSTNLIGAGGFGSVYKGLFLNGVVFAIKVFNPLRRGASNSFITECDALRNIRHKNLVKIITAYSSVDDEGNDFKAIVFEFMDHGSVEGWLHSTLERYHTGRNEPHILNLRCRINIAIDVACALNYLHYQCRNPIIHCDLKPSNILLDENMVAHVGDFGLARFLTELPDPEIGTSIRIRGTIGYVAPEYGLGSKVSTKGDVYSYGILLLEMLTGKKPTNRIFNGSINLHNYAWMALPDRVMEIVDTDILIEFTEDDAELMANKNFGKSKKQNKMEECITTMFKIGVACSMDSPQDRPEISNVLRDLEAVRNKFEEIEQVTDLVML